MILCDISHIRKKTTAFAVVLYYVWVITVILEQIYASEKLVVNHIICLVLFWLYINI